MGAKKVVKIPQRRQLARRVGSAALLLVLPHFNFILTLIEKRKRGDISNKSASKSGKDERKEGYMKAPSFISKKVSSPSGLLPTGTKSSKDYINMTSRSFTWKSPLLKLGNWDLITPEWLLSSICTKSEGNTFVEVCCYVVIHIYKASIITMIDVYVCFKYVFH